MRKLLDPAAGKRKKDKMKQQKHVQEANRIGSDSWPLAEFEQCPTDATAARQIECLQADKRWQELHKIEASAAIDRLISAIENI